MLEYEKKVMLTSNEYLSILMLLCKYIPAKMQTNYYFDNDDLQMNEKGVTCRIRYKDGKYKTTVKRHNADHPECSVEIDLTQKDEFDPQIFELFGLHLQGELVTERVVVYKDSTCEMVLDRNVYLGKTDYELEVEYSKESEHKAQSLIEEITGSLVAARQIKYKDDFLKRIGQGMSKSQRFFEQLKNSK